MKELITMMKHFNNQIYFYVFHKESTGMKRQGTTISPRNKHGGKRTMMNGTTNG